MITTVKNCLLSAYAERDRAIEEVAKLRAKITELEDVIFQYENGERDSKSNDITANEYQKLALRTNPVNNNHSMDGVIQGVMGLNGEAGEAIDIVKKHLFQGHYLDTDHLAKELGDVAWYIAATADAIGYDLSDILEMNIDKLSKRYPNGFESEKSIYRREDDI